MVELRLLVALGIKETGSNSGENRVISFGLSEPEAAGRTDELAHLALPATHGDISGVINPCAQLLQ